MDSASTANVHHHHSQCAPPPQPFPPNGPPSVTAPHPGRRLHDRAPRCSMGHTPPEKPPRRLHRGRASSRAVSGCAAVRACHAHCSISWWCQAQSTDCHGPVGTHSTQHTGTGPSPPRGSVAHPPRSPGHHLDTTLRITVSPQQPNVAQLSRPFFLFPWIAPARTHQILGRVTRLTTAPRPMRREKTSRPVGSHPPPKRAQRASACEPSEPVGVSRSKLVLNQF